MSVYEATIKKYGVDIQLEVVIEECAELIIALQKFKRTQAKTPNADVTIRDIIAEAVDVEIMLEQLKHIFPRKQLWATLKRIKLSRMSDRLKGET